MTLKPGITQTINTYLDGHPDSYLDARGMVNALATEGYQIYDKDEVEAMFKALKNIAGYPTYEPAAQELQKIASATLKLPAKGTK